MAFWDIASTAFLSLASAWPPAAQPDSARRRQQMYSIGGCDGGKRIEEQCCVVKFLERYRQGLVVEECDVCGLVFLWSLGLHLWCWKRNSSSLGHTFHWLLLSWHFTAARHTTGTKLSFEMISASFPSLPLTKRSRTKHLSLSRYYIRS